MKPFSWIRSLLSGLKKLLKGDESWGQYMGKHTTDVEFERRGFSTKR